MTVIDSGLVVKHFVNNNGVVLRIVGHGNGDVVVMASGHGAIARWDAGVTLGTVGSGWPVPWEDWNTAVMELAHDVRRA